MLPKANLDLYNHAVEMCQKAWKPPTWKSDKYKRKLGFMLQSYFGKSVWTLKDLDDAQMLFIMNKANERTAI